VSLFPLRNVTWLLPAVAIATFLVIVIAAPAARAGDTGGLPPCTDDSQCDDGDPCTVDTCEAAAVPAAAIDCGDGNGDGVVAASDARLVLLHAAGSDVECAPSRCDVDRDGTIDTTDALIVLQRAVGLALAVVCFDGCVHDPLECPDDGVYCNGDEACFEGSCASSGDPCSDGPSCADQCNETEQNCFAPSGAPCTNDDNECTDNVCDGAGDCMDVPNDDACDDGMFCNGDDSCMDGTCSVHTGDPCADDELCLEDDDFCGCTTDLQCDDGDACTDDACDAGHCLHDATECDDAVFCNGVESCDSATGCVAGSPPDCSDSNECTIDDCDGELDRCVNDASAAAGLPCDDGLLCTEPDQCDGAGGCTGPEVIGDLDVIDFEAYPAGTILDSVSGAAGVGPVGVSAMNPNLRRGTNAAIVYDTSCAGGCSGDDLDLGTPNEDFDGPGEGVGGAAGAAGENALPQGNAGVVAENVRDSNRDGLVDEPDDQGAGPVLWHFDFAEIAPTRVDEITVIDVDRTEAAPVVDLLDASGASVGSFELRKTGNNGIATATLEEAPLAVSMTVSLRGSAAIDDIAFEGNVCVEPTLPPVTVTTTTSSTTSSTVTTTIPVGDPVAAR